MQPYFIFKPEKILIRIKNSKKKTVWKIKVIVDTKNNIIENKIQAPPKNIIYEVQKEDIRKIF